MKEKFFIQRGSFGYVCVLSFDANPEWKNRPFEVVAIEELEQLKNKIKIMREALEFYANDDGSFSDNDKEYLPVGFYKYRIGKRARQALKKIEEMK